MTDPHASPHAECHGGAPTGAAPDQTIFAPAELEMLHTDDRQAATYIICLMLAIFTMGLIGYLAVCFWVA
jgi:hypothetical protein